MEPSVHTEDKNTSKRESQELRFGRKDGEKVEGEIWMEREQRRR